MLELALEDIRRQGVNHLVVETYRPQERQNYLYCQGRTVAECVSKGINQAFAEAYSNPKTGKVTWTLNSVHKSRKAVDVVPQRVINGKLTAIWNTADPQTQIIIKTMQKYGFEAGANWTSSPDSPHFQVKGEFTNLFDAKHNTVYVTRAMQTALGIKTTGKWDSGTDAAVITFRKSQKYKTLTAILGADALRELLSRL
jgi:peptidoglycan L-alanyl-D-glutamate endopeptidase CwlK